MRWNDWVAVGVAGIIVAVIAYVLILAAVAGLEVAGFGVAFRPFGWPLWLAITCGVVGALCLTIVDYSLQGID